MSAPRRGKRRKSKAPVGRGAAVSDIAPAPDAATAELEPAAEPDSSVAARDEERELAEASMAHAPFEEQAGEDAPADENPVARISGAG